MIRELYLDLKWNFNIEIGCPLRKHNFKVVATRLRQLQVLCSDEKVALHLHELNRLVIDSFQCVGVIDTRARVFEFSDT